jgi:lipoyl(octanoyl) transferase
MTAPFQSDTWLRLSSGPGNAALNMALDAALLETAPLLGQPVLRFYSWTERAASFGYFQKFAEVRQMTQLQPLVRRPTGGGLVPHDADWTYSVTIPPNHAWYALSAVDSYRRVHEWVRAAFLKLGVPAELASDCRKALPGQCFVGHEKFDVLWHGQKIAGAAQRRTRSGLLIQGSVQPPAIKIQRVDWEHAFCDVAVADYGIVWKEFAADAALNRRAAELAETIYAQATHNERR